MREIKFRQRLKEHFWHNDEKFHYWGYIDDSFVSPMGKNETVGDSEQFTGLADIKGVEIYEGDIAHCYDENGDGMSQSSTGVVAFCDGRYFVGDNDTALFAAQIVEVIGDIHQNPELLNKAK